MKRSWMLVLPLLALAGAWSVGSGKGSPGTAPAAAGSIGGRVVSEGGTPEAGVWVIAESYNVMADDGRGPDAFRKIVVTDDAGRFLVPDLPDGTYDVWVRGYGLKDSRASWKVPGKHLVQPGKKDLEIAVEKAKTPQEAAKVYPANFWYAMLELPPKSAFPGDGKTISKTMDTQAEWMGALKLSCNLCHQIGTAATRLASRGAWETALHKSPNMFGQANAFGYESLVSAFTDWSKRIHSGEVPAVAPPRPEGIERNVVVTQWQVSDMFAHTHDISAVDRRKPASNPNGPVYLVDYAQDWLIVLDPVKNTWKRLRVPTHPNDKQPRQAYTAVGTPVPGGHSNFTGMYDHSLVAPHNAMMDEHGRAWLTTRIASWKPDYCARFGITPGSGEGEAGGRQGTGSFTVFDPKTQKFDVVPVCFGTHHLEFGDGPEGRLWTCSLGYLDTNKYDPDDPASLEKIQGIADFMVDSDGDGKKDKKINGGGYGVYPSPDGSAWNTQVGPYPGRINHYDPATKVFETFSPPKGASGPRGIAVDSKGIVWTAFSGSGHLARFDRSKCKQTWGLGDQCPEGWSLWKVPGPVFKGWEPSSPEDNASSTMLYFIWVDRYNASGFGENTVVVNGTGADALFLFNPETEKFTTVRVPYPLQYNSRGSDARIDDPAAGWKGRGMWSMYSSTSSILTETNRPSFVKMQIRPNPLAE